MVAPRTPPPRKEKRHLVARTGELPPGERVLVEIEGRTVGVFNVDGRYVAFLNRCPHMGGPLCEGEIIGLVESSGPGDVRLDETRKFLTCPLHGWEFDVDTGQSYFDPQRVRAKTYRVEVSDDSGGGELARRVPGPYTAEMFDVEVDDEYVVLITGRFRKRGSAQS